MSTIIDTSAPANEFTPQLHHDTYDFIKSTRKNFGERRVLITGASKGIGRAMATSYARAGYSHIALLARSSVSETVSQAKEAAKSAGHRLPQFLELSADLASVQAVNAAANTVQAAFGSLDILINNAGYLEAWKPVSESDPQDWWRAWEVNVKGAYLMDRAFLPLLLKGNEKTLITVSSAGAWATHPGASAYQGSKLAQVRLNNHLNAEYGDQGLLVYAIHPGGGVKTDLASGMPENMNGYLVDLPELAGDALVWLTQERRTWLADRYLSVCWDMEQLLERKDDIVSKDLLKLNLSR